MSKITLIVSDLDGTLLTPNGQIAPSNDENGVGWTVEHFVLK